MATATPSTGAANGAGNDRASSNATRRQRRRRDRSAAARAPAAAVPYGCDRLAVGIVLGSILVIVGRAVAVPRHCGLGRGGSGLSCRTDFQRGASRDHRLRGSLGNVSV